MYLCNLIDLVHTFDPSVKPQPIKLPHLRAYESLYKDIDVLYHSKNQPNNVFRGDWFMLQVFPYQKRCSFNNVIRFASIQFLQIKAQL